MKTAIRWLGAVLCAALLSGCTPSPPEVTWFGNRTAATEGPRLYCTITASLELDCPVSDGPTARLSLFTDDAVQVNIPGEVADRPWLLVISYADGADSVRTPIVNDEGETLSYTVSPNGHPLKQIDLQVLTVTADANGQPQYSPFQIWVLAVDAA